MMETAQIAHLVEVSIKIVLAVILSGLIGLEREFRQKGAGLRTHILVGVGSALIVLTSLHLFETYKNDTIVDPTRMITGIVTGIGFLCAGTIIRAGANVRGLTTAATLWIVSGLGVAIGAGDYMSAIVVTVVVSFVLIVVRSFEVKLGEKFKGLL
ncbi:Mg(2+)-transport-ATPase-associated protein MgtC [hydrothermal vent metagenome]|uniref:Mg(2+)-transport-ATPase-associated protein MgtC n=1 Tax=hydrothermal vent metagenome TaxID=652676 RepID=A0A3B1DHK0_9ZZZZ